MKRVLRKCVRLRKATKWRSRWMKTDTRSWNVCELENHTPCLLPNRKLRKQGMHTNRGVELARRTSREIETRWFCVGARPASVPFRLVSLEPSVRDAERSVFAPRLPFGPSVSHPLSLHVRIRSTWDRCRHYPTRFDRLWAGWAPFSTPNPTVSLSHEISLQGGVGANPIRPIDRRGKNRGAKGVLVGDGGIRGWDGRW